MKSLELKGGILELVSKINDAEVLKELKSVILEFIEQRKDNSDFWDDLTSEQQKELEIAIKESFDEKNWISEKDANKQIDLWLNK